MVGELLAEGTLDYIYFPSVRDRTVHNAEWHKRQAAVTRHGVTVSVVDPLQLLGSA